MGQLAPVVKEKKWKDKYVDAIHQVVKPVSKVGEPARDQGTVGKQQIRLQLG